MTTKIDPERRREDLRVQGQLQGERCADAPMTTNPTERGPVPKCPAGGPGRRSNCTGRAGR